MILAVIPLIPLAWVAGAAATAGIIGWFKGRDNKKKLEKVLMQYKKDMKKRMKTIEQRQKQHEDDFNGIIVNQKTGQTAEEVEFGIFPKKYVSKQVKKTEEDDINEVNDRFEILDL